MLSWINDLSTVTPLTRTLLRIDSFYAFMSDFGAAERYRADPDGEMSRPMGKFSSITYMKESG